MRQALWGVIFTLIIITAYLVLRDITPIHIRELMWIICLIIIWWGFVVSVFEASAWKKRYWELRAQIENRNRFNY